MRNICFVILIAFLFQNALTQDKQALCDRFYKINNKVTITIDIDAAKWNLLRREIPDNGYNDYIARSVTVTGSEYPLTSDPNFRIFNTVTIRKKGTSTWTDPDKPSLKINFGDHNESNVEKLIGTKHLTLNNSMQDYSLTRQILQNKLCQIANLPYQRCNYIRVIVKDGTIELMNNVYVNMEPIEKRFIKNNFGENNDKGNLYELQGKTVDGDRVDWDYQQARDFEGYSEYPHIDLNTAANYIIQMVHL